MRIVSDTIGQISSETSRGIADGKVYSRNMNQRYRTCLATLVAVISLLVSGMVLKAWSPQTTPQGARTLTADDCTTAGLGSAIPAASIGEPVAGVTLAAPRWVAEAGNAPAYCSVDGAMAPTDTSSHGRAINFRVVLPASWTSHAV